MKADSSIHTIAGTANAMTASRMHVCRLDSLLRLFLKRAPQTRSPEQSAAACDKPESVMPSDHQRIIERFEHG